MRTRYVSNLLAFALINLTYDQQFASAIVTLTTQGSRILVGDMQESVYFAAYKAPENRLLIFADDSQPRWITAATMVDYNTVVAADRFGNVFVNRLDSEISDQVDDDPTGAGILQEKGILMGAPHKTQMICEGRRELLIKDNAGWCKTEYWNQLKPKRNCSCSSSDMCGLQQRRSLVA